MAAILKIKISGSNTQKSPEVCRRRWMGLFFYMTRQEYQTNPKRCEYCGIPISFEKRENRYCNSACYGKDNPRIHVPLDVRQKISKSLKGRKQVKEKKDRICDSCGDSMGYKQDSNKRTKCKICFRLSMSKKVFLSLGIIDTNLKNCDIRLRQFLIEEYIGRKRSAAEIAKRFGLSESTLGIYFKKYGIKMRTCSLASALYTGGWSLKSWKKGEHTTWWGKQIRYRSSYEKRVLHVLDDIKEFYFYEDLLIEYILEGKERFYIPDFYIPRLSLIVEVKNPYHFEADRKMIEAKEQKVRSLGYKYILWMEPEIKRFEKEGLSYLEACAKRA